jgi:hypothetical protein
VWLNTNFAVEASGLAVTPGKVLRSFRLMVVSVNAKMLRNDTGSSVARQTPNFQSAACRR